MDGTREEESTGDGQSDRDERHTHGIGAWLVQYAGVIAALAGVATVLVMLVKS